MTPRQDENNCGNTNSNDSVISNIYLIRHGDRFDFANPSWIENAKATGNVITDPPLSALGHRQANETSKAIQEKLKDADVSLILSSPYLRVIQTSVPTSEALGIPICIEEGLSEAHATPNLLPTPSQRFAYFPQINPEYKSIMKVKATPGYECHKTGKPCEAFAGMYVKRMELFAKELERQYHGQTVVCFSHAASVALVAALLRCDMVELKFAPCGIYHLRQNGNGPWELVTTGSSNEIHVSENSRTTYPWRFEERNFQEEESGTYHGSSQGIGLSYFVPEL